MNNIVTCYEEGCISFALIAYTYISIRKHIEYLWVLQSEQ